MLGSGNGCNHPGADDGIVLVHDGNLATGDAVRGFLEPEKEAAVAGCHGRSNSGRSVAKLCLATSNRYIQATVDVDARC